MDFDGNTPSIGTWHDCHMVDLELAKLRLLRGCQRVRFDFMGRNNNHLSPLPTTPTSASNAPLHSPRLTPSYNNKQNITKSQHRTTPASSFARTISIFIHTPYTPPSLNICTLHYTASIRCSLTRPPITASTPSSETRATTLQQAV